MSITDHAVLAPSSAHIWAPDDGCRASVRMQVAYPGPEDTPEAREGTAAHFYVTELLMGRDVAVGGVAPNGHPINAEMVDAAQGILLDVRDTIRLNPGGLLYVEQRMGMATAIHALCWGTPDVVYFHAPTRRVFVWDYKYGHRFVDARGNWQLVAYLLGVLETFGVSSDEWHLWRGIMSIVQPRNYHAVGPVREWQLMLGSSTAISMRESFRRSAAQSQMPDAPYRTGDHCRDCSARHACPALQRAGAIAMDVSLQSHPVDLPPHAVGLELRQIDDAMDRLKARQTGLEEQALALIRGGTGVPFFTAQHASGREVWQVPAAEVFALGDTLGVDLRRAPDPITPGQARKAGLDGELVKAYAGKPMGALKLTRVQDDDAKLAFE